MTTQTITLPCRITFEWFPEEKETFFEPRIEDEFFLTKANIANVNIVDFLEQEDYEKFSVALYEYLKESKEGILLNSL